MRLPSLGDRVSNRPRVVFAAGRYTKQERADGLIFRLAIAAQRKARAIAHLKRDAQIALARL
jgi:hypothetical protein